MGELVLVADGIGGYRGGGTASRIVVETFASWVSARPPNYSAALAIAEAAAQANTNIRETAALGEPAYRQMGSTVVLALITQDEHSTMAWIGHIGDSRAYLARAGVLSCLTRDHSAVQALIDQNQVSPENARSHPDASVLTRSLGHQPEVEIEITMTQLEAGDSLLLCSDGLWGFVPEQSIANVLTDLKIAPGEVADQLLHLALQAGGQDNIGIEVVRYSTPVVVP
jgi:serine/threonine protein phosphatase PrpC